MGNSKWEFQCDCGNIKIIYAKDVISGHTKSCGCGRRKHPIDEKYFEKIDTQEKAYVLGIIASDGNISNNLGNMRIALNETDSDILEKIVFSMNYKYQVKHYTSKHVHKTGESTIINNARIDITNQKFIKELLKYGITPAKSNTMDFRFDLIPEKFLSHFLRGLWDGDGSISIISNHWHKTPQFEMNITSCIKTINSIDKILHDKIENLTTYIYHRNPNNLKHATLYIANKQNVFDLLKYLYTDASIYMDRKYQKYIDCMNLLA